MRHITQNVLLKTAALSLGLSLLIAPKLRAQEIPRQVSIQQKEEHVFDVYIPAQESFLNDEGAQLRIALPPFLQKGFVEDDVWQCVNGVGQESMICNAKRPFSSENNKLHFVWDSAAVLEDTYCVEVIGEKQKTPSHIAQYAFDTDITKYVHRLTLTQAKVENSSFARTYADFSSNARYTTLWSWNGLSERDTSSIVFERDVRKPLLGNLFDMSGTHFSFYAFSADSQPMSISQIVLTVCSVPDVRLSSLERPLRVVYKDFNSQNMVQEEVFAPLQFTYTSLTQLFSPTDTPTTTLTLTFTPTTTPTPTINKIVITPATLSPTLVIPASTTAPPATATSLPKVTPVLVIRNQSTEEQSPTATQIQLSAKEESDGEVLGEAAPSLVISKTSEPEPEKKDYYGLSQSLKISVLVIAFGVLGFLILRRRKTKVFVVIFSTLFCWSFSLSQSVAAAPITLVKMSSAYSYPPYIPSRVYKITYSYYSLPSALDPGGTVVASSTPDGTGALPINGGSINAWHYLNGIIVGSYTFGPGDYTKPECNMSHNYPPQTLPSALMQKGDHGFTVRFFSYCAYNHTGPDIYLVYFPPEPTSTPTSTQTPTPTTIAPFLDLPWDYRSHGVSFTEAALAMTSYFDHEYPMLSVGGYDVKSSLVTFQNSTRNMNVSYSSHDGYDYGNAARAHYGEEQLAAASGVATLHTDCAPCGNAIYIDHGNGYQTRYYHLDPEGIITSHPNVPITVQAGQPIGRVGFTGRIIPASQNGAHVHFMVIYDKNHDGDFDDNIPDGLVDPYGWQGDGVDPWEVHEFEYPSGNKRTGMKSSYLWKHSLAQAQGTIGPDGGTLEKEKAKIIVPAFTLPDLIDFFMKSAPRQNIDAKVQTIGSVANITATDGGGAMVKAFAQPITIQFSYTDADTKPYIPETIYIYSSPDGAIWQKEQTLLDHEAHTATTSVTHLTFFALAGERKDLRPPLTEATLEGVGTNSTYRSDVTITLHTTDSDTDEGSGGYILYMLDHDQWRGYTAPLTVASEGAHTLTYFSVDIDGNTEDGQTVTFSIDKTPPEISLQYDVVGNTLTFSTEERSTLGKLEDGSQNKQIIAQDEAGNIHTLAYTESAEEGLYVVHFVAQSYNDISYDLGDLYAISTSAEGPQDEFVRLASTETRIIPSPDDLSKRIRISADGTISEHEPITPLQLVTNNGKLTIHHETN